ncbi:signal peptidase I [Oleiagrimonas sp. C23AA]|uniref:signal peptidase I n=1 Tax=Oleiagrimonas sp. C23AA TaxID=2719047 RepID=UPI0014234FB1|nr:signal peptidase I [Oleiagrimonas sp. C23AA]NII10393.1 signal peptidase I [Oleiagrimonas sp. C23AA]
MELDFAALLLGLTVVFGIVWALDILALRKARARRAAERGQPVAEPWYVDWSRSLFPVVLAVLILRSFVAEPFRIPSGSMMPTLKDGDFILVNKFDYGLRLPVFRTKVVSIGEPKRGDVVVFRPPWKPSENWIKRIVGLPGDHVVVRGEKVWINGQPVNSTPIGPYEGNPEDQEDAYVMQYRGQVREERLGDVTHKIIEMPLINRAPGVPSAINPPVVPAHCYFVMGDNRDNSEDSRYHGCVPEQDLVGKAFLIWFSWDHGIAFSRIGKTID